MRALLFERSVPRFAASRIVSAIAGPGAGSTVGPLRLTDVDPPELPGPDWYRVTPILSGICGSDLASIDGHSSRYFEDIVSFPFVPGHEIVGIIDREGDPELPGSGFPRLADGTRVVVEPVIGCIPRGIDPPCDSCAKGLTGGCERVAFGHLSPGLQIGFCADTGGGWSGAGLVAHSSQLHQVPDSFTDEDAVMVEPTACAVHAVLAAKIQPGETVAVLGAGTLGLLTTAAIKHLAAPGTLLIGAKHAIQRHVASLLGADTVVPPAQLSRAVRLESRSLRSSGHLTGGADVVIDCVGSSASLEQSLSMVRPRGRVILVGMPGKVGIDLTSLWHREVSLIGAYAYGTETIDGQQQKTFDLAIEVVGAYGLGRMVTAKYPLGRFEEAMSHAAQAGKRGAIKIVFDLKGDTPKRKQKGSPE
jgi:threonine dehydrogenase-like Zn-dependent dehydrogenase